ncbi:MAG TPA: hypothetical protein VM778_06365 [Gemmatimonadota bacterium]|nr:hypothetical protein [Gemmatimonadota bacterium]
MSELRREAEKLLREWRHSLEDPDSIDNGGWTPAELLEICADDLQEILQDTTGEQG